MVVFLVGFMGSGKTSLGRRLAARLGWDFVDMDAMVEQRCGMNVARIFETQGEEHFRRMEREVLEELAGLRDTIVATGGGVPVGEGNMELMNRAGLTIYLMISPPQLVKRLERGTEKRPLIRGKDPGQLLEFIEERLPQREPYYMQAKAVIDCNGASDAYLVDHAVGLIEMKNENKTI